MPGAGTKSVVCLDLLFSSQTISTLMKFLNMQPHFILLAVLYVAGVAGENAMSLGTFLPPMIEHFFHADLLVGYPTNTTTLFGLSGRTPNAGGMLLAPQDSPCKHLLTFESCKVT